MGFHCVPNSFISQVALIVEDFERSLKFYQDIIGFKVLEKKKNKAILTVDGSTPLLTIEQPRDVTPKQVRTTGLYHYALLLSERSDLAKILLHLLESGYPLQGASDHLVSEAIYLADPDGFGIEIYVDRPASTWVWSGSDVVMDTKRLDVEGLLSLTQGEKWNGLKKDTIMGHIHLHVSELKKTEEFYTYGLGFQVVNRIYGDQALFLSTGNYHHHIGMNIWNGLGAPKPSEISVRMTWYGVKLPNESARREAMMRLKEIGARVIEEGTYMMTEDPSGNKIRLEI
ncbi:VOC family protein [Bacillus sp. PS06]|uniref:VOC family protein n=1 Tax=Bacillus sp. PS06 TaxID=2764176 RepID=UPI00177C85E1|nr:VOC family protein [Bacillus sp. PS06]MBD8067377.1 VOC family protein [Bacillus sp. PS06]